jgi:hypothetical protein
MSLQLSAPPRTMEQAAIDQLRMIARDLVALEAGATARNANVLALTGTSSWALFHIARSARASLRLIQAEIDAEAPR